jgi:ABC-type glycerol-3-phosphate transport system permease component
MDEHYVNNDSHKVSISSLIPDLVPEHINQTYPDFIEFLELFNDYLVSENRASHYINRVADQRDILDYFILSLLISISLVVLQILLYLSLTYCLTMK